MTERRSEPRLLCSHLIKVSLKATPGHRFPANLEDISPSGACVQLEQLLLVGAGVSLICGMRRYHGTVKYCVRNEIGYFAGVQFAEGIKWSAEDFTPDHLLDPTRVMPSRPAPNG